MSKGNMYEGVITWNPLGGECPHKCAYCSTNTLKRFPNMRYKYSGDLRMFSDIYKKFTGEPKTIFVVGQNDLFAKDVPDKYIKQIINKCNEWDQHTWLFQTKNPIRFHDFSNDFPKNTILCTTIETNRYYKEMGNTPMVMDRAMAMRYIYDRVKHITIEPIMDFDLFEMVVLLEMCIPDQVNIGADSKNNNLPEPSKEKILQLIAELEKFTVVKQKSNLKRLLK